jgi:protein-disulfide isomerase
MAGFVGAPDSPIFTKVQMKAGNNEPQSPMAAGAWPGAARTTGIFPSHRSVAAIGTLIVALAAAVPAAVAQTPTAEPLAEVNGVAITARDVERALGAKLSQLEEQIYTLKRKEVDSLIAQTLFAQEAAKRGVSVAELLDAEVTSKVALVTEKEIDDYYRANKARMRGDEVSARVQIRSMLQQQKLATRRAVFLGSLRRQANIVVRLVPPPATRIDVAVADAPVRGAPDAAVTIVEFSDFECPFCKRTQPTLTKVLEKYSGRIKLAYRDFPLDSIHPQARAAAEAARCAQQGGKFWEYHDALFAQSPKLGAEDLKRSAKEVGLDVEKFDACIASGATKAGVEKDVEEGNRLGITGTPAFFINGRLLSGAQPVEAFTRVIDDELARTESATAKAQ